MAVLFRERYGYKGDFTADSAEIEGAYIAAGVDPNTQLGTSRMILEDVKVTQAPDATKMNLDVHRELKTLTGEGQAAQAARGAGAEIGLKVGDDFYTFTGDPALSDAEREAQVQATYQDLKATPEQIASGKYPFSNATVVIRTPDGQGGWAEQDAPANQNQATNLLENSAAILNQQWTAYRDSVTDTQTEVKTKSILNIDLSKFTSGASRTTILYYIET